MYNKCIIEYIIKMMGQLVNLHSKYIPFKEVHFNEGWTDNFHHAGNANASIFNLIMKWKEKATFQHCSCKMNSPSHPNSFNCLEGMDVQESHCGFTA